MSALNMSMPEIQGFYDHLRKRFFIEIPGSPFFVPPTSAALDWEWIGERTASVAETVFRDGVPFLVRMRQRRARVDIRADLLHEMTHMRLGIDSAKSCIRPSKIWKAEQMRLAKLGAKLL